MGIKVFANQGSGPGPYWGPERGYKNGPTPRKEPKRGNIGMDHPNDM